MTTLTFTSENSSARGLKYEHLPWGELIYGTKDELQRLGIAPGLAFPGELGGPKRELNVLDPRGFSTSIDLAYDRERYCASIKFPGRDRQKKLAMDFAPGVHKRTDMLRCDEYIGTADALAAAGLVRVEQLPGQPGMRKVRVVIFSDGTLPTGAPTVRHARSDEPGAKSIERASKTTYCVRVKLSADEQERRRASLRRADEEYEVRMRALSRPVPLDAPACMLPGRVKGKLRSVWSAQGAAPGFSLTPRATPADMTAVLPSSDPDEISLLRAFRAADDRARDQIFGIAQRFSKEWPRHARPSLRLIPGGANERP